MTLILSDCKDSFLISINNPTNVPWDFHCELCVTSLLITAKKSNSFEYYETKIEKELKGFEYLKTIYDEIQNVIEDNSKIEFIEDNNQLIILMKYKNDEENKIILSQIWNNNNGQILWDKYMSIENKNNELIKENEKLKKEIEIIKKENEKIKKENEIIKKENKMIKKDNEIIKKDNERIKKENEILQNKNKDNYNKEKTIYNNNIITKFDDNKIHLGINIGASKTVYSKFSKINDKHVTNVLLMNNSSRIIPSIICYTKDHRLFGENSISSIKQNLNTSYNNLSRLIGFDNSKFFIDEIEFGLENNENISDLKFNYYNNYGEKENITTEYIIADYLSLINEYYFEKEKYEYDSACLSVPDFYNLQQKQLLKIICEAIGMKEVKIFNESSAITMYYGYTKYRDLFVEPNKKLDKTIVKNILFIDSGYSKTSFVLSSFKYNEFRVKYIEQIKNLGGRNFDNTLLEYCIEQFKNENNLNIENSKINSKSKYKLLLEIQISRIKLSVNDQCTVFLDVFHEDKDLNVTITRKCFEQLIENYIEQFVHSFNNILNYAKDNKINIDYVEIAGDLMRTPILQKIIEEKNLKISKTILIDECTSVGAALLGNYFYGKFPISQLKLFHHYNYYNIYFEVKEYDFENKKKPFLNVWSMKNDKYKDNENRILFGEYLNIENLIKNNKRFFEKISPILNFYNDGKIYNNILYESKNNDEFMNLKTQIKNHINSQKNKDIKYEYYLNIKTKISKCISQIKNAAQKNNILNEYSNIKSIDKEFRKNTKNKDDLIKIKNDLINVWKEISNKIDTINKTKKNKDEKVKKSNDINDLINNFEDMLQKLDEEPHVDKKYNQINEINIVMSQNFSMIITENPEKEFEMDKDSIIKAIEEKKKKFKNEKPEKFIDLDENHHQQLNEKEKKKVSEFGKKIQEHILNYLKETIEKIKKYKYQNDINKLLKNQKYWQYSLKKKVINFKITAITEFLKNDEKDINKELKDFLNHLLSQLRKNLSQFKNEKKE